MLSARSPLADRVRRAQRLVAVLQLLPVAVLLATSTVGFVRTGGPQALVIYVVPVTLLIACLWQLRRSWQSPVSWGTGGAYAAGLAGLATGAVVGFGVTATYDWRPGLAVPLAIGGSIAAPVLVLLAVWRLRRYAIGAAQPAELADSELEVPFDLVGSGAALIVGPRTVALRIARSNYWSVIVRIDRNDADLGQLHVQQVQTVKTPVEIELGGIYGTARVPAGTEILHLRVRDNVWLVPLADAGPAVELIRLRKARLR